MKTWNAKPGEIERQWQLRLERARYEADLAHRRYNAVDPDNRLVARTLEQEWEALAVTLLDMEAK